MAQIELDTLERHIHVVIHLMMTFIHNIMVKVVTPSVKQQSHIQLAKSILVSVDVLKHMNHK